MKQDFSHLKTGRINLLVLRDYILQQIRRCSEQFTQERGNVTRQFTKEKVIIIDDDVRKLLNHIQALNEFNAGDIREFKDRQHDTSDYRTTLFVVRPKTIYMELIADMIKDEMTKLTQGKSSRDTHAKQYGIIFVPRRSRVCEEKLKDKGVRADVVIDELNLDFLPIDTDLLSMELNECFRDVYLNADTTPIFNLAHGLVTLQQLYGIIPNVFVKGDKAKQCYDSMVRMQREVPDHERKVPSQIENLILIDRTTDLITPMMIPATYEALLDEKFGIQLNRIEVPTMLFSTDFREVQKIDEAKEKVPIRLLTNDQLYSDTRYSHMTPVGRLLQEGARAQRQLRTDFDSQFSGSASNIQGKKLAELREFVTRMSNQNAKTKTLSTHLELAYCIKQESTATYDLYLANQLAILFAPTAQDAIRQIDERIAWKDNIFNILRYFAILTHALGPQLKRKEYDGIKKDIVQTFGLQYLVLINALERVGLLYLPDTAKSSTGMKTNETALERLKKDWNLLQEDQVNVSDPQDIFYVFYQYAPISIRLIERIVFPTGINIQETMNILPGITFIDTQQVPMELKRQRHGSTTSLNSLNRTNKQNVHHQVQQPTESKVTMVVFIGGITYGEIAALRFLADQNRDFIIATTNFTNGTNLMKSLLDVPILPL